MANPFLTALQTLMTATSAIRNDDHQELVLFLLVALILIMSGIGLRDPWPTDEPRFALVAKQMVDSGDWLIPHRGSELYADKPPAFMVMQALAYELTGNWRVAFLLPSALAALGTLLLVYDLARRLWGHRIGLYAAGALLATFQFVFQSKRAQIDPAEMFFVTLANYGLLRHFLLGPAWRWYWFGCFAAGLGVIVKGVGFVALFMFAPYVFARARAWNHLAPIGNGGWRWGVGGVWFVAAVALWLMPLLLKVLASGTSEYSAYAHEILFHQTAGRYQHSWDHYQPVWFYLGVAATSWLPLALAYPATFQEWYQKLRSHDARFLLPLAWVVLVIVFFSIPSGKRDVYIMPALPCVALVTAPFMPALVQRRWFRCAALALIVLIGVTFLAAGLFMLSNHPAVALNLATQHDLADRGDDLWYLLLTIGLVALACAAIFRTRRGTHALLTGMFGIWMLWSFWACPLLNDSNSAAGVMRRTGELLGASGQLGLAGWEEPNLFLADRQAVEFGLLRPWGEQLGEAIRWQEAAPGKRWVLTHDALMSPCVDRTKAIRVGIANRRRWWLFRDDAVEPGCRGGHVPPIAQEPVERPVTL